MIDFIATSVAHGLSYGQFDHLSDKDRKKLNRLMARIAEAAYRRGAQHGAYLQENDGIARDLVKWRFNRNLDAAPWLDGSNGQTSVDRLHMEHGVLSDIGFKRGATSQINQKGAKQ